jgi:hypothetical protein
MDNILHEALIKIEPEIDSKYSNQNKSTKLRMQLNPQNAKKYINNLKKKV